MMVGVAIFLIANENASATPITEAETAIKNLWDEMMARWSTDQQRVINKIIAEANKDGVDPALALGVAQWEQRANPFVNGITAYDNKSYGIFQIQPSSAGQVLGYPVSVQQLLTDEDINIEAGVKYIAWLLASLPDEPYAIAAYNHGIGNVQKGLFNPATDPYTLGVQKYEAQWATTLQQSQ